MPAYFLLILVMISFEARSEFRSKFNCVDSDMICLEPGEERLIHGAKIYRDCWKYKYIKTCSVPSKDNCEEKSNGVCSFSSTANKCLSRDYTACLNEEREITCLRDQEQEYFEEEIVVDPDDPDRDKYIMCNMQYMQGDYSPPAKTNNITIADVLAQFIAIASQKEGVSLDFPTGKFETKVFAGCPHKCVNALSIINFQRCCPGYGRGWSNIDCNEEEKLLKVKSRKDLCLYAGKVDETLATYTHMYCCYNNKLDKAVAKYLMPAPEDRRRANCGGFTLEQMKNVDFSKINLNEFKQDILKKAAKSMNEIDMDNITSRIKKSIIEIDARTSQSNKRTNNKRYTQ